MKRLKRLYHWLYAHIHGYYWTTCYLCGMGFGGHEDHETLYTEWVVSAPTGHLVCSECVWKAKQKNKIFFETHDSPYVAILHEMVPVASVNMGTRVTPEGYYNGMVATTCVMPPKIEWITREEYEQKKAANEANSKN